MKHPHDHSFDLWLTRLLLVFTLLASGLFLRDLALTVQPDWTWRQFTEAGVFALVVGFLIYGNVGYQLTRNGYLLRLRQHRPATPDELEQVFDGPAPTLHVLVPSYKEELRTVRQTLLSAALQGYPNLKVTLLLDDPCHPDDPPARDALAAMRELVKAMDSSLRMAAAPLRGAWQACMTGAETGGLEPRTQAAGLAQCHEHVADWLEQEAALMPMNDHTDAFFAQEILCKPAATYRERAAHWRRAASLDAGCIDLAQVLREHARLAALFDVRIDSFERKRFANLSHEPNKAMNLNTFMALIGGSYREVARDGALHLQACEAGDASDASMSVETADYLITLDADSLLLPGYALTLVRLMEQPGHERIAVAQTPYSAVPGAPGMLERIAGATTDIQYLVHQGFTQHGATYWVGANAVLRKAALEEIAFVDVENGHLVKRYIQDRTVIEDTESTIELLAKGWTLHNHPERLAYSATPPDFGALAVQRGRWANGGLIILPKLLRYLMAAPLQWRRWTEGFFRIHYLSSIAGVNVGLVILLAYPFPNYFQSVWLPLTAVPYYLLYARDLHQAGYRHPLDILRVYALNLLLLPVNVGGVLRSLHQAVQGHKIPFKRTPKVEGRTQVATRYVAALFGMLALCFGLGLYDAQHGHWARASFGLLNGAILFYAICSLVGFGDAWDDLCSGMDVRSWGLLDEISWSGKRGE